MTLANYDPDPTRAQREIWEEQQTELRNQIELEDNVSFDPISLKDLSLVGGVDVSFRENDEVNAVACLVVMSFPDCKTVYTACIETKLHLPYISGFLAFREADPILKLLSDLNEKSPQLFPQLVLVDGNGRLHPRLCGVACHVGVLANVPTIGVGKNFLVIQSEGPLLQMSVKKTCRQELKASGDRLDLVGTSGTLYGTALRATKDSTNPIFVSQGHRVSLDTAVRVVLATCQYRVPEPIRQADKLSRLYIQTHEPQ
ncbi:endonuclease V [Phycomyces nitens]|nr:endonuclease V [Phycomyces nitens]